MPCKGSSARYCGGLSHLQPYSLNEQALPPHQNPGSVQAVGDYKLVGCDDDSGMHALVLTTAAYVEEGYHILNTVGYLPAYKCFRAAYNSSYNGYLNYL